MEQNNFKVFEDNLESPWDKVRYRVAIWLYNVKEFGGMLFADLARDWTFLLYFSMVIKSDFYFSNL